MRLIVDFQVVDSEISWCQGQIWGKRQGGFVILFLEHLCFVCFSFLVVHSF